MESFLSSLLSLMDLRDIFPPQPQQRYKLEYQPKDQPQEPTAAVVRRPVGAVPESLYTIPESPDDPFWITRSDQPDSGLLNLPYDVLMLIKEWLPRENSSMLALTCKKAMVLYYPKTPLVWNEMIHVRRLMEPSVSDRFYYCWECTYLHRHDQCDRKTWRIRTKWNGPAVHLIGHYNNPWHDYHVGVWTFHFRHFQLIMNEHLYGPGHGTPLSPGFIEAATVGDWNIKPSVAILDDQLFLSVRYAITVKAPSERWPHMQGIKFCHHLQDSHEFWAHYPTVRGLPGLEMVRDWWQSGGTRMPQTAHMQGHCDYCLTDYTIRMRRNQDNVPQPTVRDIEFDPSSTSLNPRGRRDGLRLNKNEIDVEIVTYHQLGAFRTPHDWMWRAFTERTTDYQQDHHGFLYSGHAPGSVKNRWEVGVASKRKLIQGGEEKSA